MAPADLVLRDGSIYTVDAVRSWAHALAVREGRIVYVGTESGVVPYIGAETEVLELKGRTVLPSFQDVHIHPVTSGTVAAGFCDLSGVSTREEYLALIAEYAAERPDVEWIRGEGWSMDVFPAGVPDKQSLDGIVPDRPVYLGSSDGHSAWVNSKALDIAGITSDTPDPADGRIDRDPVTGEPVGGLQEGAMNLVQPPQYTADELDAGLRYALKMLHGYGVTAFQEASADREVLETYRRLDEAGDLSAHVVAALWWERERGEEQIPELIAKREEFSAGNRRATTVKIMQDGVMENHTAALLEPYQGKPGGTGISFVEPGALKRIVTRLDAAGFQVHFHAIGDAAIRQALDAVEAARTQNGERANRHHISHLQLFDPVDIGRFRELGVVANFQPLWAYADGYITDLTIPFLGPERSRWLYPIGSLVRSGAIVAFGSDWSVSSANPFEAMEVAITRMGPDGESDAPFLPGERIDLPTALAAFTIKAAYVNGIDDATGSIEVGKLADLIVLDRNPFEVPPAEISEIEVLLTLFAGAPVHGDLLH
ncbi:MAG: amidohydrolase [Myxococcales bacterium]|nr:MAG: amidohydrolase [Myxococcales bacterium]